MQGALVAYAYDEEETATGVGVSFLVDLLPELTPVVRPVAAAVPKRRRTRIRPERVLLFVCAVFGISGLMLGILARPLRVRALEADAAAAVAATVPVAAPGSAPAAVTAPQRPSAKVQRVNKPVVVAKKKAAMTTTKKKAAAAKGKAKPGKKKMAAKKKKAVAATTAKQRR